MSPPHQSHSLSSRTHAQEERKEGAQHSQKRSHPPPCLPPPPPLRASGRAQLPPPAAAAAAATAKTGLGKRRDGRHCRRRQWCMLQVVEVGGMRMTRTAGTTRRWCRASESRKRGGGGGKRVCISCCCPDCRSYQQVRSIDQSTNQSTHHHPQ